MTPTNPKRRHITVLAIAASLVAILGGALVFAHAGEHHGPAMAGQSAEDHLEHVQMMLTRIGASEAQKTQIEAILKPALDDMKATHDAHFAAFKQFHEAISAPSIDRARLESLRVEQVKLLDEASKRLVVAISDAAEVLSPDQRAALAKEIENHHRG
ncbi:MAG TPA: periplasmic heavy metal sensor [Steroidobacteraceae bacterium]|jgi:Spy/CpxP family protein refolding chaperone|nr:periplasmic heavy metal sensor [Steroidobacteraceae bacterium]